jgi:nitrogenase molybdenum-iron protein alpha chain
MGILSETRVPTRERRLSAITAFQGTVKSLIDLFDDTDVRQRIRTFSQNGLDEITAALDVLFTIADSVTIIHGSRGCSAAGLYFNEKNQVWYTTALDERDTILGGDEKLREIVYEANRRHAPKAIFIVKTPVVAINNDDTQGVIFELQDDIDAKILTIDTDGFKTKNAQSGIDIVNFCLAKFLIHGHAGEMKNDAPINLISLTEQEKSIDALKNLLQDIGVDVRVIPRYAAIGDIEGSGRARANFAVNDEEADILLQGLQEKTGILSVSSPTPIGVAATSQWLLAIAKQLGLENEVHAFVQEKEEELSLFSGRSPLAGKKIFISLPLSKAIPLYHFIEDLGGEVVGIATDEVTKTNVKFVSSLPKDLPLFIGSGQVFELCNHLRKNPPDFFVGDAEYTAWTAAIGIIPISIKRKVLYGYEGARELIEAFDLAEKNPQFHELLAQKTTLPYKASWLSKSASWYIKQEVK